MAFKGMTITNAGKRLLAQAQANKAFSIKCIRIGDGTYNGDYHDITNLVYALYDAPCAINHSNNNLTIEADISSNDHSGYYFREVALIALDSNNNEIVYAYDNAGDDAEYINPSSDGLAFEKRLKFFFTVVDSINVTVQITGSMYTLKDGDVSETYVTFNEISDKEEPKSGEKLKTIFAKICKLFNRVENLETTGVQVADTLKVGSQVIYRGKKSDIPSNWKVVETPFINPNLAINSDFKVWQEGEERTITNGYYIADVWRITCIDADSVTLKKVLNGLQVVRFNNSKVENPTVNMYQYQELIPYIDQKKWIRQKSINDKIIIEKGVFKNDVDKSYIASVNFLKAGDIVNWVKVELGDVATPFVPRSYGEELMLCQRYYQTYDWILLIRATYYNGNSVFTGFPLCQNMRNNPTSIAILSKGGTTINNDNSVVVNSKTVTLISITNIDVSTVDLSKLNLDARFY